VHLGNRFGEKNVVNQRLKWCVLIEKELQAPEPLKTDLSLVLQHGKWKPFGRNMDASDNVSRLHRRHGQNERGIGLNRKNALFAGHDAGAENWADHRFADRDL
jgi:hypothetical protein